MGHARALINIENDDDRLFLFEMIVKEGLSVRKVEELAKSINEGVDIKEQSKNTPKTTKKQGLGEGYKELQSQLDNFFNTKTKLKRNDNGKGQIVIPFKSDDELERIIGLLDHVKND